MKLAHPALLTTIFGLKRNFTQGCLPSKKVFSGIEIAPFKDNARGAVSISSDFEMSWAWRGRDPEPARLRGMTERQNVPFILGLLEEYSIPITWATVGHLFLESCSRSASGCAHPEMPRPKGNTRFDGDWYMHDPCTNVSEDPLWYAPDLIQQVIQCKAPQEIGTHTFSHFNFSPTLSTPELVKAEIQACNDLMRPLGLRARSLVFPHNIAEYSYLPLLAETGITSVRHRDESVRLSYPERTASGVYRIYESMNLRVAKHYDYADKARIFIEKAMERQAAYSLWFHPSDSREVFDVEFRQILRYIAAERRAGRLWVTTMSELAAYCEAREQLHLTETRTPDALQIEFESALDTARYGAPELTLLIDVPSRPKSAKLDLKTGERTSIDVASIKQTHAHQIIVNTPAAAKSLRLDF